ncbi:glycosyltransferase [uncultured Roseovarius sp.]|uniref:glycosyltransferase family 2 protein n=1 Tax=uncultured Roseovarius sp. TaxID=293344 RepID=UPI00260854E2|nr:glycosyltransferase [uncultured Roseovarius sp.]
MLKVQVVVPTFNHAEFIAKTLDSILMQRTTHRFEILVHDDASTDGTQDIIKEYAARHRNKFKCIFQKENQFQQGKRIASLVWPHYKAKYIAYLDGDDLWTNPDKLQTQVDFMDAHPRCMISQTYSEFFDSKTGETIEKFPPPNRRDECTFFEDLAPGNYLLSSAVMHRRSALPKLPPDFNENGFGDYAKFALIARTGWIGLIPIEATRYRVHENNMWFRKPFEERLKKTQMVQKYVAKNAPRPFDELWNLASTNSHIPHALRLACGAERMRRIEIDEALDNVQIPLSQLGQKFGIL